MCDMLESWKHLKLKQSKRLTPDLYISKCMYIYKYIYMYYIMYIYIYLLQPCLLGFLVENCHQISFSCLFQSWNSKDVQECSTSGPYHMFNIWMFPKILVPQNGWFIMENPIKMDDFGGTPLFLETPILSHIIFLQTSLQGLRKTCQLSTLFPRVQLSFGCFSRPLLARARIRNCVRQKSKR